MGPGLPGPISCFHAGSTAHGVRSYSRKRAPSVVASVRWAGEVPTRTERAGSMPWARANASTRPGSGGRHQQIGGPPPCGQTARSTGPDTTDDSAAAASARSSGEPSGSQSKTRCGAVGRARWIVSRQPCALSADAPTKMPARPVRGSRSNETRSIDAKPSSSAGRLELAEHAHLGRRCHHAGLVARRRLQLLGRRERAEPFEEPIDHVDLRLRKRRVDPHASHACAVARRGLDHVTPRREGRVRVVENDPSRARRERRLELVGQRAERPAALVAIQADVAACHVLLRDAALPCAGDPHHEHDLSGAGRRGRGACASRRHEALPLVGVERDRRRPCRRACGLGPARARDRDHVRAEAEHPGERDLCRSRVVSLGDVEQPRSASETLRTARPAERRVRDHGDIRVGAALDHAALERVIV